MKKGKKKVEGGRLKAEGKENQKPRYIEGEPSAWVEETIRGPEPVTYKMPLIDPEYKCPSPFGMIYLEFKSAVDKALFDHIVESARVYRRTPDQQILWMVQEYTRKEKPEIGWEG